MSHFQNKNPTILLVEEDLADVELTSIALRKGDFNHTLCVVNTGEYAMAFLRQEGEYKAAPQPDLILLDLNLAGKSGLDVLKEIREDRRLSHIPIVILTASAQQPDMWQAKEAFADLYMTQRARLTEFVDQILAEMSQKIDSYSQANASRMEHQILDHVKSALRVTLAWKAPSVGLPRKVSAVQFTAKSFQRHLDRVMTLEEFDGYMAIVAESKPNLDGQVARLRADHDRFRRRLEELAPRLEALNEFNAATLEEVCEELTALLDNVDRHDIEEIELLQDSMLSDEGGEG